MISGMADPKFAYHRAHQGVSMPIYEYECRECGHVLDALQKIDEAPLQHCPACGKHALKKLLSAPQFRLKGGGWYETDFKSGNKRNVADDGKSDKSSDKSGKKDEPKEKKAEKKDKEST